MKKCSNRNQLFNKIIQSSFYTIQSVKQSLFYKALNKRDLKGSSHKTLFVFIYLLSWPKVSNVWSWPAKGT